VGTGLRAVSKAAGAPARIAQGDSRARRKSAQMNDVLAHRPAPEAIWTCIRRAHVLPFGKKSGTPQAKVIVELTEFVLPTLVLLLLLQVKHVLADFILTSAYIIQNRWIYGHPGGLLHVAIHLVGSLIAFLIAGLPGLGVLLILLIGEAVLHYHIDWTKDNLTRRYALTPKDAKFWWAMGIDQFLHQATYLVMAGYWAARVLV
jgi:hypothetical protein